MAKKNTTHSYVTLYIPRETHELLRKKSFLTRISISQIINSAVLKYFAKNEEQS